MKAKYMPAVLGLPLLISAALATDAQAAPSTKSYVLQSTGTWGPAQDAVVAKAGGSITYKHSGAGFATVESSNKNFLSAVKAAGGINGAEDQVVQWQRPTQTVDLVEDTVTPGDETFAAAQWNTTAVNAQAAWNLGYTGAGVRVAVIDGGMRSTHVDLSTQIDVAHSTSFVPGFAFNQDVGTFWHGSHVAGIIAAADNNIGIVGIAPGATIVGVKALHGGSGSFGQVISAILYAATPVDQGGGGADIINMSLGAFFPRSGGKPDDNNGIGRLIGAMASAVNYATDHNVLVISAAGNDAADLDHTGSYIDIPAESGSGIAVSATGPIDFAHGATNFDHPASYTNYGTSAVWVAGPGGDFQLPGNDICVLPRQPSGTIVQYCWALDMVLSANGASSNTSYSWAAGTSMAAPAVAGVAALIKQAFPGITADGIKAKLAQSATVESPKAYYGKGFVNAGAAVQ